MKKIIIIGFYLSGLSLLLFAGSYTDNPYQKRAREYKEKSEKAFNEGEYDRAVEYSILAEENADLSEEYVTEMLAKYEANSRIIFARSEIARAKGLKADVNYPSAFDKGQKAFDNAMVAYSLENWSTATVYAQECIDALEGVKAASALPKYYIVAPWEDSKDCYWNISAEPYVYNNPLLWEKLYEANKDIMPDPSNPNLLRPGMKLTIPSLNGELREGVYSPSIQYDTYEPKKSSTGKNSAKQSPHR